MKIAVAASGWQHSLGGARLAYLLLAVSTQIMGEEIAIKAGTWEPIVPLRHPIFSVAVGLQIANVNDGRPEEDASLMTCLEEMAPPILRLPGGDSMND